MKLYVVFILHTYGGTYPFPTYLSLYYFVYPQVYYLRSITRVTR